MLVFRKTLRTYKINDPYILLRKILQIALKRDEIMVSELGPSYDPKRIIKREMGMIKHFNSILRRRTQNKVQGVSLQITYHSFLKTFSKIISKHLCLLELQTRLSFNGPNKIGICSIEAKL